MKLIENGEIHSSKMEKHIYSCLDPMLKENIDALVLGCTHYAFLIPQIKKIVGNHIQIIDSGLAVAKQTKRILTSGDQINSTINKKTFHNFYINRESKTLVEILKKHNPIKVIERDF